MQSTRQCETSDCARPHYARGWCKMHYLRHWSAGSHTEQPRTLVAQGASLEERLRHIGWDVTPEGCWEWKGSRNARGYGQVAVGVYDGKISRPKLAHRIAYQVFKGEEVGSRIVRHKCDNPPCVNPAHLELGTRSDNAMDMMIRGRNATAEFRRDHVLTAEQVQEIRSRYAAGGVNQRALAAEYGCSQQLVSLLVRGFRRTALPRAGAASRTTRQQ